MRPETAFVRSESAEWPSGWTTAVLREVCLRTSLVDPVKMPDREFNYVDVSAVSSESLRIVGTTTVRGATAPSRARKLLRSHDVIFATVRPTLRRVALVPPSLEGNIASTAFCVLRANTSQIDPSFLYYTLITEGFVQRIGALERGASYPAVSDGNVLDQEILLPPLAEQRAIAGVLSNLQVAVEVQDRIVATLKELKAATMAKLFREGLRGEPLKQTEIGELPESWRVKRFGDFATLHRGFDLPIQDRVPGPVAVIGSNGVVGSHDVGKVKGPGVVTGRSGTIGLSFYSEKLFWPLNTSLFVSDFHGNDPLFTHYLFGRFDFSRFAAGVSVPTLNRNLVHEAFVGVPEVDEQQGIGKIGRLIDLAVASAAQRRNNWAALFSTLLDRLLTGRIRVAQLTLREKLKAEL